MDLALGIVGVSLVAEVELIFGGGIILGGRVADWLVGSLIGCLVGCLIAWLVAWLHGWLVGWLVVG